MHLAREKIRNAREHRANDHHDSRLNPVEQPAYQRRRNSCRDRERPLQCRELRAAPSELSKQWSEEHAGGEKAAAENDEQRHPQACDDQPSLTSALRHSEYSIEQSNVRDLSEISVLASTKPLRACGCLKFKPSFESKALSTCNRRDYSFSSPISAFASFRSAVSKPSVNQS
jgi:hypothetical protein